MAQIPYTGTLDVSPTDRPTPYFHINAVADAFGVGVGKAIQHLGAGIERSSNELFNRAMALQQLRNETEAREADAQYMIESGKLHAEYNSLQGRAAVDAFPKYQKDLDETRQNIRKGLTTDQSRKMYDSSSLGFMGRNIFNGAGHAATQNKIWSANSAKAGIDPLFQQIHQNPYDDNVFQTNMEEINKRVDQQAALGGWGEDQTNREKALHLSLAIANRIEAIAERGNPVAARQMLEANRDKIFAQHRDRVENFTQAQLDNTGARVIADNVRAGWAPWMAPGHADRASGVDRTLVDVVKLAQKSLEAEGVRVTIGGKGGKRTPEEQAKLVAEGRSQTYNSDHLYGRAIDLVPLDAKGKENYNDIVGYNKIVRAMEAAANRLGVSLAPKSEAFKSWDPGHFSLAKDSKDSKVAEPTEKELVDRGVNYAKQLFPENTLFHDYTRQRISAGFGEARRQRREAEAENLNIVYDGIMGSNNGGRVPKSVEELTMDPRVQEAFNNLEPAKQYQMTKRLENVSKAQQREQSEIEGRRLRGMAINEPNKFLSEDILNNESLSYNEMKSMLALQGQIRKQPDQKNPQIQRALSASALGPKLTALGLTKALRPDDYNMFIGTLQDVIIEHMKDSGGKPPTIEELKTIGNRLLQETATPSAIFGNWWPNKESIFTKSLPPEELDKVRKSFMDKHPNDPPPDDESLQREYRLQLYETIYKGKGKPKPEETKKVPGAGGGLGIGNE